MDGIKLTEGDKRIFVTSLNKLDNPRARELVQHWVLSNQYLDDNVNAEKWDEHKDNLNKLGLDEKMDLQIHEAFVDEFKRLNKLDQEIKQLKEQVARELKDNNKLREYNTKMFQKLEKIKELDLVNTLETLIEISRKQCHPSCVDDMSFLKERENRRLELKELLGEEKQ